MSINLMTLVFEQTDIDPSERLVLLALAHHADKAGRCFPSVSRIMRITAMSERGVQSVIGRLKIKSKLKVVIGIGPKGCNVYLLTPAVSAPPQEVHPRTECANPPQEMRLTPAADAPKPSLTIKEPSLESARRAKRKPEVPIPDNWVPSDRNIADAEERQFSAQEIRHEADKFRNHHVSKGNLYRDWDAAWRTWLGNARKYNPVAGPAKTFGGGSGASIASIVAQRRIAGRV